VRCHLCGHRCVIPEGKLGVCRVRQNIQGELITLVYGRLISQNVDPIEKKPLYHLLPGSKSYSIATVGCNFQCRWCQNWEIAQFPRRSSALVGHYVAPQEIIANAQAAACRSIAYTYTEPTIFFEYSLATARLAHQAGIANVYVTNGYMTTEMLQTFHPYLTAANVDLKGFRKHTYAHYARGSLQVVLDSIKQMKALGIWVEITTLVVPGINDDQTELKDAARFIANEIGTDTPWHISRFFPGFQMTHLPPTPLATLEKAHAIGREAGLHFVYLGNVAQESNTHCPHCNALLIRRHGYWIVENNIKDGKCKFCGTTIPGHWD
jgi:pyruvate formate lyase activating enzyme